MGVARGIRQSRDLEGKGGLGARREGRTDAVAPDCEVADGRGLSYEVLEGVGLIRIDRPDKLGAFTWTMIDRWAEALVSAQRDEAVRAVVVTGTGRGFCTGGDLDELALVGRDPIDQKRMLTDRVHRVVRTAADLSKPLICAVNGLAVGAGMDMGLLCDIRRASESSRFGTGYVRIALVPGAGRAFFLPRLIGTARALELFWTGDWLSAQEAREM